MTKVLIKDSFYLSKIRSELEGENPYEVIFNINKIIQRWSKE